MAGDRTLRAQRGQGGTGLHTRATIPPPPAERSTARLGVTTDPTMLYTWQMVHTWQIVHKAPTWLESTALRGAVDHRAECGHTGTRGDTVEKRCERG